MAVYSYLSQRITLPETLLSMTAGAWAVKVLPTIAY
jgi:hypothetical protein